ncbi:bifunctional alpha/beta hydrolase/OsmC family protein [Robertkochia sediminum]|uniref:bifunctional alpha/beta hydrolase/OsmC family protein n=1 Tax=Robertkochia sediminum TaxID=2785326 RepID=UPI0019324F7B|nr:bifunctional alpha/beta hydrolase/OsmC family protein [Robertkochia sediminum]MBL7472260.1 alpha/beta fold hydrolase [Robertkochia sediminum]
MTTENIKFTNRDGIVLSGRIDLPVNRAPHTYAIFAHCFTCSKNFPAVKNISKGLTSRGFAVLRFDFTGLGNSEGDFSNTNFSANINDLEDAAAMLQEKYTAPELLVGHSLGGAAVLLAARKIASVKAVVTIGAPSHPSHVTHLLEGGLETIEEKGSAEINIGGRTFTIRSQFLNDLNSLPGNEVSNDLRLPLLILHSPQDRIVEIDNARELYQAAHHPKSFVSLDGADHLLSRKEDSLYAGDLIGSWAQRYIPHEAHQPREFPHQVMASLDTADAFTTEMIVGHTRMIADEPEAYGGAALGPTPYELLGAALASCTAMTLNMYLGRKEWKAVRIEVFVSHTGKHVVDCEHCDDPKARIDHFERTVKVKGTLDGQQMERLLQIADKCPVHKTLSAKNQINTTIENA